VKKQVREELRKRRVKFMQGRSHMPKLTTVEGSATKKDAEAK